MDYKLLFLILVIINKVGCANILYVIPFSSPSHYILFRPIGLELARRGHNVTVITSIKEKDQPSNYRQVMVDDKKIWDIIGKFSKIHKKVLVSFRKVKYKNVVIIFEVPYLKIKKKRNSYRITLLSACPAVKNSSFHTKWLHTSENFYKLYFLLSYNLEISTEPSVGVSDLQLSGFFSIRMLVLRNNVCPLIIWAK